MATTKKASERFPQSTGRNYYGHKLSAYREAGKMTAIMNAFGRTNAHDRQAIADSMATVVETAHVEKIDASNYRVTFTVTHRILPIEEPATR